MHPVRALILAALAAFPTLSARALTAEIAADWRGYGISGESGYACEAGLMASLVKTRHTELLAGGRLISLPDQRLFQGSPQPGSYLAIAKEARLYYLGIPVDFRVDLAPWRIRPFVAFGNQLDIKILEQTEEKTLHACTGSGPREKCLDDADFREVGKPYPVVWRTGIVPGAKVDLSGKSLGLGFGLAYNLTPTRGKNALLSRHGAYLKTLLALQF